MNVFGKPLKPCSMKPLTGFYRDGACNTGSGDTGVHAVCVVMTEDFLIFSKATGNDLSTPVPEFGFQGLSPGDQWCLCVDRWKAAFEAGVAPPVVLSSTHLMALEFVSLNELKVCAVDEE